MHKKKLFFHLMEINGYRQIINMKTTLNKNEINLILNGCVFDFKFPKI